MLKYFVLAFAVFGIALVYVYLQDPCNRRVRADFAEQHPTYRILDSGAEAGSPESVRCLISYRKPDSAQVYEDVLLYLNEDSQWKLSRLIETREKKQTR